MKRKTIVPVVLVACFAFMVVLSGCSSNQIIWGIKEKTPEKTTVLAATPVPTDTASQKAPLVKVTVEKENEKVFDKPEDIKIFTTAIETGTPMKSIPEGLKAPTYFVYFYYSDNETVEYFLYISQNDGWIYKNGTREAYTLSKGSVDDLNRLLQLSDNLQTLLQNPQFQKEGLELKELKGPVKVDKATAIKTATAKETVGDYISNQVKNVTVVLVKLTNKEHPRLPESDVILQDLPVWIVTIHNANIPRSGGGKNLNSKTDSTPNTVYGDVNVVIDADTGKWVETFSYSNGAIFTEAEAIAKAIKDHPEFPDKAGVKETTGEIRGKSVAQVPVQLETKIEKNGGNAFTVTLTKTWGMTVNGKTPVSFWKYDVSLEKVALIKEDTTGGLISIIK